jgi:hypothetical protein
MSDTAKGLTQAEREMADYIAEKSAVIVIDRLRGVLLDEKFADNFFDIWGGKIDRTIGRGLRRLGFYVLVIMVGLAAVKFGFTEKLLSIFGLRP